MASFYYARLTLAQERDRLLEEIDRETTKKWELQALWTVLDGSGTVDEEEMMSMFNRYQRTCSSISVLNEHVDTLNAAIKKLGGIAN